MHGSRSSIPDLLHALRHGADATRPAHTSFGQAVLDGAKAKSVGKAFQAGYQAALQALVPNETSPLVALCVTEEQGQHPKLIETLLTYLDNTITIRGAKKWAMAGDGVLLIVAKEEGAKEGRPSLRIVRVPTDTPGLERIAMPPTRFIPDVPHTRLQLDITLPQTAILPGDGYADYVKPFRTLEDIHVHASVMAYTLQVALFTPFSRPLTEAATGILLALEAHAARPAPTLDVALTGTLSLAHRFFGEADTTLFQREDEASRGWQRDKPILLLGAAAREARANKAWAVQAG